MIIKLQNNASEVNKLEKKITDIVELDGSLRDETSLENPAFLISADLDDLADVNYCYIPKFKRYYYTKLSSVRKGICRVDCTVDPLMSFASDIKKCTGIIRRNTNAWNLYLNDGSLKVYQNPKVITKKFPSGFDSMSFLLAVAGG